MPRARRSSAAPTPEQLQELGRVDRAAGEDDLTRFDALRTGPTARHLDPDCPAAVEQDPVDEGARSNLEVPAAHHGVEVGARRGDPSTAPDVPVERPEALLAVAVDVVGPLVPGLHGRLEEGAEQRVGCRPTLEPERAAVAAIWIVGRCRGAVLHPLEVRQAVRVRPRLHARVGRPALVVERVAALEDHPVDRARAAQDLAPRVVDPAAAHERLGLRLVLPVVEPAADRERERGRHVDEDVEAPIGASGLEHEDARRRVRGQSIREGAPGRAAAHDDEVVPLAAHLSRRC